MQFKKINFYNNKLSFFHQNNPWSLRKKCPNTEFFLVRIFLHSACIWRFTEEISVFSPNTGKYEPEKTPHFDTFHAVDGILISRVLSKYLHSMVCVTQKDVLKICSKFTGEHPCQKVISIKLQKRCSENMQQTYRRAHMTKCDFNKVAWQLYWYQVSFTVTLLKNYKANPGRSFCRKRFLWYQTNILIGLKKT